MVAGAFVRPVRGLIVPALAVALPAAFVAAAGIDLDGGYGEKRYRPAAAADVRPHYEVGAGRLVIDLRDAELPAGDRRMSVDVGMGEAVVLVPEEVCVTTTAQVGMGAVEVFDRDTGGVDVSWEDAQTAKADAPRLVVDADVGLGALEVQHDEVGASEWRWRGREFHPDDPRAPGAPDDRDDANHPDDSDESDDAIERGNVGCA